MGVNTPTPCQCSLGAAAAAAFYYADVRAALTTSSQFKGRVLTEGDDVAGYTLDWLGQYRGEGSVVLRPKSTEEASQVLRYCNEQLIAVNLQGGNTGLVGGGQYDNSI